MENDKLDRRRSKTFANKMWRIICGPVCDTKTNGWRRKFNKKIQAKMVY